MPEGTIHFDCMSCLADVTILDDLTAVSSSTSSGPIVYSEKINEESIDNSLSDNVQDQHRRIGDEMDRRRGTIEKISRDSPTMPKSEEYHAKPVTVVRQRAILPMRDSTGVA